MVNLPHIPELPLFIPPLCSISINPAATRLISYADCGLGCVVLCLLLVSTGPGFPAAAAQLHQDVAAAGSSLGVASLGCGHQHHQKQGHYVNWAKCCKIRDDILVFYCPALPD